MGLGPLLGAHGRAMSQSSESSTTPFRIYSAAPSSQGGVNLSSVVTLSAGLMITFFYPSNLGLRPNY
jgi:hypothetical protein